MPGTEPGLNGETGMPFDIEAYRARERRIRDSLDRAVAALSPARRARWAAIRASYEYFDGETEIEAGYFVRWKAAGYPAPKRGGY